MNPLVKEIADFVRKVDIGHSDPLGTWIGPSRDAEEIARKIEEKFGQTNDPTTTYGSLA